MNKFIPISTDTRANRGKPFNIEAAIRSYACLICKDIGHVYSRQTNTYTECICAEAKRNSSRSESKDG